MATGLGGKKVDKDIPGQKDFDIPEGNYLVKPYLVEERSRQDTGDKILRAEFEIIDVENKKDENFIGMKFYEVFSLTDEAMWRVAAFLRAAYDNPNLECSEIPDDIYNKQFVVRARKNYNPKTETTRTQCQLFNSAAGWSGATTKISKAGKADTSQSSKNDDKDVDL